MRSDRIAVCFHIMVFTLFNAYALDAKTPGNWIAGAIGWCLGQVIVELFSKASTK